MKIHWTTLIGIRQNIKLNIWKVNFNYIATKEEILKNFNRLFKGQLEREVFANLGNNPLNFKNIPAIEINMNKKNYSYEIYKDNNNFIASIILGLENYDGEEKLCFNFENKGLNDRYFSFLRHGDEHNIEINSIIKGTYNFQDHPNQNIRRLVSMLYETHYPIIKNIPTKVGLSLDLDVVADYTAEERNEMLLHRFKKN